MDLRDSSVSHNSSNKYCETEVPCDQNQEKEAILWKIRTTGIGENHKAGKLNFLRRLVQWNLYKETTKILLHSRQLLSHKRENKDDYVNPMAGKFYNLNAFSSTFAVSYRRHCTNFESCRNLCKNNSYIIIAYTGIIVDMGSASDRWHYNVMSLIGGTHTQNDPSYIEPYPEWSLLH